MNHEWHGLCICLSSFFASVYRNEFEIILGYSLGLTLLIIE